MRWNLNLQSLSSRYHVKFLFRLFRANLLALFKKIKGSGNRSRYVNVRFHIFGTFESTDLVAHFLVRFYVI